MFNFFLIESSSYIDFKNPYACAQMYWFYIVFFQLWTMLNKLHYLKRDNEGSRIEQAKEMDLKCPERRNL